jgi:pantoate--beta-alanine ligase
MEIINRRQRMASVARKTRREEDKTIGLVPTMGALHDGHLSLVREARRMCDVVVVSVFVNPTQFGPGEDFQKYPRDLTKDTTVLADYNVDYIFAPSVDEVLPRTSRPTSPSKGLSEQYEGASRPGHFRGVATVLAVLFNTRPPRLRFLRTKDAQQTLVVRRLVRDSPSTRSRRTADRARRLRPRALLAQRLPRRDERKAATSIYRALSHARETTSRRARGEASGRGRARDIEPSRAPRRLRPVTDAETMEDSTVCPTTARPRRRRRLPRPHPPHRQHHHPARARETGHRRAHCSIGLD